MNGHPIVFTRDALPAWPCGWPEPEIVAGALVWDTDEDANPIVLNDAEEVRGVARRLLELADEMDQRLAHEATQPGRRA